MEKNRLMAFLGGKTSYFVIGLVALSALAVFLLNQISYIFNPLVTIVLTVMPPVIFAGVLYYVFNPLVSRLSKKISRTWAVAIVFLLALLVLGLAGVQAVQVISSQAQELVQQLPDLFDNFQAEIESFFASTPFDNQVTQLVDSMDKIVTDVTGYVADNWQAGASSLGNIFSAVSSTLVTLFTGPIIAFFLLKDPQKFYQAVLRMIPPGFRPDFKKLTRIANQQLGDYLKGQVIASLVLGVMYWITFLLIGLNYATVLAVAAGILCIIPYVGPFIAFLPGLFIAFQDSSFMVIKFLIVWFAVQLLHGDLVVPRVMGDRLKIHPITILVVLLVMGDLLGFVGVIFGIPIYTLIKLVVVYLFSRFKQRYNRFFKDKGTYEDSEFSEEDYLE
ncbi:AI-2E family transporter [Enterococcus sp. LJL120]